ncbi:MAG TPA: response regulator [Longimicrobium sp.]
MEVNGVTLLLIEDDHVDAEAIQRAFRRQKIANPFVVVRDGVEALAALRGEPGAPDVPTPYLILLDINMPRMNGIEFLRELRADPELGRTTVVVLTTSNDERDKIEAYNLNVAGYLLKPVTFSNFCEVMATLNKYWTLVEMP